MPVAPDGRKIKAIGALPVATPGGDRGIIGRTFELEFSLTI
jgi:hypothetical protein